jgi:predicted kinase
VTARTPKPILDQVIELQIAARNQKRETLKLAEDVKRSASQAEGAIEDVRSLSELARRIEERLDQTDAAILTGTVQYQEVLKVLIDMATELKEIRQTLELDTKEDLARDEAIESARKKGSGAYKAVGALEQRLSKTEQRQQEWDNVMDAAIKKGRTEALATSDKTAFRGALGAGSIVPVIVAIVTKMSGQTLDLAIGLGVGVALTVLVLLFVARHFRKVQP